MIMYTVNTSLEQTEWLYTPGLIYHQYDTVSRELGILAPHRPTWEQDERFPLVAYIPGETWHKQELYIDVPKYTRLAEEGVVFAIIQVRESDIAPFPAQIEDIHRAVWWLLDHAEQFHIDSSRVFLAGNLSGGHLALMTAFSKAHGKYIPDGLHDYQITGVIAQEAISDLKMCLNTPWGKRPATCLMGAETDKECRERADAATCKNYVSSEVSLPRVLLFHYADDPVVNCQMSRDLYDCLAKTDDTRAHYYELKGYQNSSLIFWNVEFVNAMSKFITSCSMQTAEQYSDSIMDITPKERHVLSVIRKHPGLIGPLSLRGLESFLGGYQCALATHELQYKYSIYSRQFHDFAGHKYKQPGSLGYANAILQHIPDGKEAIEAFFECLDEFLSVNGFEKIERI